MDIQFTEEDKEWLSKNSACLLDIGDPEYPENLRLIQYPPKTLAVLGNIDALRGDLLSIVGGRDIAPESTAWMEYYLPELIKLGVVVVSGGARGVDQRAHSIALRNKSKTVVVLPSGFKNIYPKDLNHWKDIIIDRGGCLVSELRPDTPMRNFYFHKRNRIVVGLSKTLLLVEARRLSGSSMTARLAMENSRTVCVVPGPPTRPNWIGGLDFLADGATLARDAVDVWLAHSSSRLCEGAI